MTGSHTSHLVSRKLKKSYRILLDIEVLHTKKRNESSIKTATQQAMDYACTEPDTTIRIGTYQQPGSRSNQHQLITNTEM